MDSDSLTSHAKQQDRSTSVVTLEIRESDDPLLIGNKCLRIRSSRYIRRAKLLRPHALRARPDRRRDIALESEIAHLLAAHLLEKSGWKIAPHSLGRGTHPLTHDPAEFIERIQERQLPDEIRAFLSRGYSNHEHMGLRCDLLIADKRRFALLEIKSTKKDSPTFHVGSLGQFLFYLRAAELGIPVKFVHVKFLDSWRIILARFPKGELIRSGAISPMTYAKPIDYWVSLKLLILRYLARNPAVTPATITSELDDFPVRVEWRLDGLFKDGLVKRVSEAFYCRKCRKEVAYHRFTCPFCLGLLIDNSTYSITEKGFKELDASVKLLRNHHEFVSKQLLAQFNNI